jgi:hypothetical protein
MSDFANFVATMATRQGNSQQGHATQMAAKPRSRRRSPMTSPELIRRPTRTSGVYKGHPKDYPYRMCNDSEGRIYREKLIDEEFRLESLSRTDWPSK